MELRSNNQIGSFSEMNNHTNGMWVGAITPIYPGFQCSDSGPTFCQYHWTDPSNTAVDPGQFSMLQSDKNTTCIRISNRGLIDEFCYVKLESLCFRDTCLPGEFSQWLVTFVCDWYRFHLEPEPDFTRMKCAIMERFGPIHRILPSQCLEEIGFVCRRGEIVVD